MYSSSPSSSAPVCSDKASSTTLSIQKPNHPNWLVAAGNFFFHLRNGLFPAVFLLIAIVLRPAELLGDAALDRVSMVIGVVVIVAGQFIRFFVIGYAYIRRGGKNRKIHADRLVVKGLYAHARNPMYFGNILIAAGFSIYFGSFLMTGVTMGFFGFVYLAITAAEERYLLLKFGPEYEEYTRRVNRFVPNLRGVSQSLAGHPFQWREALSKEYGTISATVAGLLLVTIWKIICVSGWEGGAGQGRRPCLGRYSIGSILRHSTFLEGHRPAYGINDSESWRTSLVTMVGLCGEFIHQKARVHAWQ